MNNQKILDNIDQMIDSILSRPQMYFLGLEAFYCQIITLLDIRNMIIFDNYEQVMLDDIVIRFVNKLKKPSSIPLFIHFANLPLQGFSKIMVSLVDMVREELPNN